MLKMLYFQIAIDSTDICADTQEENQQKSILSNTEIDSIQSLSYNSATVTKISEKHWSLELVTQEHYTPPKGTSSSKPNGKVRWTLRQMDWKTISILLE